MKRWWLALPLALAIGSLSRLGRADPAIARQGRGQGVLSVGVDKQGVLRAATCEREPCTHEGGLDLGMPKALSAVLARARLMVVSIGEDRRAIVVSVPSGEDQSWEAVVAAPLGKAAPSGKTPPLILFAGYTGLAEGEMGLRHGGKVQVSEPNERGERRILVGEEREDLTLCGRDTMLSPQVLDARTLKLVPAKVQQLSAEERDSAVKLIAVRAEASAPAQRPTTVASKPAEPALLRAVAATSALGDPGALTDGKLETAWSEARGGDGRGEFVLLRPAANLPLTRLSFVFRPASDEVAHGTAPAEFWIASSRRVFKVQVPADAWQTRGASFALDFDTPLVTDCLALVLESGAQQGADVAVTIAEVSAQSELGTTDLEGLITMLSNGGVRGEIAAAELRARGEPAVTGLVERFGTLNDEARRLALDVADASGCRSAVALYVAALHGSAAEQRERARTKLLRCGSEASEVLATALTSARGESFDEAAALLARAAPAQALGVFMPLFALDQPERRRGLRAAVSVLAGFRSGGETIGRALADSTTDEVALLDLLRALGDHLGEFDAPARVALGRLASSNAGFRVRFLRAAPLAIMAGKDSESRALLASALTRDGDARVRAQAARSVKGPELFSNELVAALSDRDVRVREAAAHALAHPSGAFAAKPLLNALAEDDWPIVRAAAARALAEFRVDATIDSALVLALSDEAWSVRRDTLRALGRRRVTTARKEIAERLSDTDERFETRVEAARALGLLCVREASDSLLAEAKRLSDPLLDQERRAVALASLYALADLGLPDLADRLKPLLDSKAPAPARSQAKAALGRKPACRAPRAP